MILVLADSPKGQLKKGSFEAVTYGKKVADAMGTQCAALVLGSCLLYTSPSPRDQRGSRMPSSA